MPALARNWIVRHAGAERRFASSGAARAYADRGAQPLIGAELIDARRGMRWRRTAEQWERVPALPPAPAHWWLQQ